MLRWWLPAKQRQLRATTLDGYRRHLRLHILPTLGAVPLVDLRTEDAEHPYQHLLAGGRHDGTGGLSPKTVREVDFPGVRPTGGSPAPTADVVSSVQAHLR